MQNIKTGIVVALLLAVCYGAFKALNEPEAELPPELNEWVSKEGSLDAMLDDVSLGNSTLGDSSSLPTIENPTADDLRHWRRCVSASRQHFRELAECPSYQA